MSKTSRQRALVNRVAAVAMTLGGLALGYLLGCVFSLQMATNWLDQYAQLIASQDDASFAEARGVLGVLQGSPYSSCSDAEIAYFRGLVLRSSHLKDAGRIRNGKIACSATTAHPARSAGQLQPYSQQGDGTIVYSSFPSLRDAGLQMSALQLGSAYVAFGAEPPAAPGPIPMHLAATLEKAVYGESSPTSGESRLTQALSWVTGGTARPGDKLYATRCSTLHSNCVTAFTSVSDAARSETRVVAGSTAAGGVLGVLLGMGLSFLFRRNRDLSQQLRRAIARDKLELRYQPIVVLSTRQIVGAEALARWTDEDGNAVDPEVFVKLAEDHGFVGELTQTVVRRAVRDFSKTLQSRPGFRLSINVAGADLVDPEFLTMLDDTLKRAKVKPESVVIEISEKSTSKSETAKETIRILRRMGHSIHIDDFGTGYSNLDKLLYLFADTIKIDKAFTGVIGTESVAVAILPQILAMAKSLNLEVIVEGVETDRQANYFSPDPPQIFGQGWLYGRPVSAEAFHSLLATELVSTPAVLAPAAHAAEPQTSYALGPEFQEPDIRKDVADEDGKLGKLHIVGHRAA